MKETGYRPAETLSKHTWGVLVIAMLLIGSSIAFDILQILGPSDGARLPPGELVWRPQGVVITPLREGHPSLQEGDQVIAVEGRSIESWMDDLFRFAPRPAVEKGQRLRYAILRDGERRDVKVEMGQHPVGAILSREWGALSASIINLLIFAIIFFKSPRNAASQALFLAAAGLFSARTWSWGLQVGDLLGGVEFWLYQWTTSIGFMLIYSGSLHFVLVFPRRATILRRFPWLVPLVYLAPPLVRILYGFSLYAAGISNLQLLAWNGYDVGVMQLVYTTLIIISAILGYRSISDPTKRLQVRWIVYAIAVVGVFGGALYAAPELILGSAIIDSNMLALSSLALTAAIVIAIYRYHIFDIDLVINRTLVYGLLSLALALVYLLVVALLERAFRPLTTLREGGAQFATVTSTLTIAALFTPLRRRIQTTIDRRFYRNKYNATQTLADFSQSMRDEVKLDRLSETLVQLVRETMQPAGVSLLLTVSTEEGKSLRFQNSVALRSIADSERAHLRQADGTLSPAKAFDRRHS